MLKGTRITRANLARISAALAIVTLLPVAWSPGASVAQEGFSSDEFSVARRDNDQVRPRISGKYVVWQDYRNLAGKTYSDTVANADIYAYNLDTRDDFKITTNASSARPAVSGSRVVYADSRILANGLDIRGYDIDQSDNFDVVERAGDQDYPAIDGPIVVWQDNRAGNWDIRGFDIDKDDSFEVAVRDGDQRKPAISGRVVVWEDYRRPEGPDIYAKNLDTDDTRRVTENNDSRDPSISGEWVAYRSGDPSGDQQRIRLYNLRTDESRTIGDRSRIGGGPHISGNLVVWGDRRNEEDYNVWMYDINSDQQFRVTGADKDQLYADISDKTVVWEDGRGDTPRDIRGARVTTPAAAATAAPTTSVSQPPVQQGPCFFTLGFKLLRDQIPDIVGECIENEWFKADDGNALQRTTGGLLVWRKADNWTAFTNGSITWLNGPCGMQTRPNQGPFYSWEGRVGAPCQ